MRAAGRPPRRGLNAGATASVPMCERSLELLIIFLIALAHLLQLHQRAERPQLVGVGGHGPERFDGGLNLWASGERRHCNQGKRKGDSYSHGPISTMICDFLADECRRTPRGASTAAMGATPVGTNQI